MRIAEGVSYESDKEKVPSALREGSALFLRLAVPRRRGGTEENRRRTGA